MTPEEAAAHRAKVLTEAIDTITRFADREARESEYVTGLNFALGLLDGLRDERDSPTAQPDEQGRRAVGAGRHGQARRNGFRLITGTIEETPCVLDGVRWPQGNGEKWPHLSNGRPTCHPSP